MEKIPILDLVRGHVYRLRCRNLALGVYEGEGFTGVRTKFNSQFLDTEDHWDAGDGQHGTVKEMEDAGVVVPQVLIPAGSRYPKGLLRFMRDLEEKVL